MLLYASKDAGAPGKVESIAVDSERQAPAWHCER